MALACCHSSASKRVLSEVMPVTRTSVVNTHTPVYAIDASNIADHARRIVSHNKLDDKIHVIKGMIEDVELPEKVDIIVSEWMGYFLFYENMLKSVITAREKWLKQGGLMFPAVAELYMMPFADEECYRSKVDFWKDVYGIDMSPIMCVC